MSFAEAHANWLEQHTRRRSGERRSRLVRGHGHGERLFLERVWWPIFGNLEDLHPEYEVTDWQGRPYFIDFVWSPGRIKFAFEIKGYGPHVQNTDRKRYRKELNRETFLQILGFRVVSIPYDDIEESPHVPIFLLKSLLSPYMAAELRDSSYTRLERDVLLLASRTNNPVRPIDLERELKINHRTAVNCLHSLCEKGRMIPVKSPSGTKVVRYDYARSINNESLF